jgi:hypothetical protein
MVIREAADHSTTSGDGRPANNGSHVMPWSVLPKVGAGGTIVRVLRTVQYSNPRSPKSDLERKRSMGPFPSPSPIRVCVSWFCYLAEQTGQDCCVYALNNNDSHLSHPPFPHPFQVNLVLPSSHRVVVAILHHSRTPPSTPAVILLLLRLLHLNRVSRLPRG